MLREREGERERASHTGAGPSVASAAAVTAPGASIFQRERT